MGLSGFICHDDYLAKTARLTDEEVGRLFRALMTYHATHEELDMPGREWLAFDFIREDIDRQDKEYEEKCNKNREIRLNAIENERKRKSTVVDEGEPYKDKEKDKEKDKTKRFTPPSVEDVAAYCRERGNKIDAQTFVDFYSSKGWKVGNSPMKDWKASVRTWERSRDAPTQKPRPVHAQQYTQRDYDEEQEQALKRMLGGIG